MTDTPNLSLPLLAPAQAQKHVTVNDALSRLDAVVQLRALSRTLTTPPALPASGDVYLVPLGGVDAWEGLDEQLVVFVNGGWEAITAQAGWTVWVADEALRVSYDGTFWGENVLAMSPSRAATRTEVIEVDFDLSAGGSIETGFVIPSHCSVWAVTGRVLETITGSLTDWSLGIEGSEDRYGSGFGLGVGTWLRGLTGQPVAYYSATKLKLTASGGAFASGKIRLAVHAMVFDYPDGD